MSDTIFALSSGGLPSGVAVIRLSGPSALDICRQIVDSLPEPRKAALRTLHRRDGQPLDQGLVLLFPGPASFTGEDCVELQIHGGKAVVAAVLEELASFPNARLAEAGEFSRRAFENGRIDLVEVEGLSDLINAETEMQRRLALEQMAGHVSAVYDGWAERLKFARAMIEAELDFPDEEDVPGSVSDRVWHDMRQLAQEIGDHLARSKGGEIIRDGLKVVISGPPNAGKSTLFNALVQRDAAIVTSIPGTTRDILQTDIVIGGFPVRLTDTAGLRETEDVVEQIGVTRARNATESADVVLRLHSGELQTDGAAVQTSGRIIDVWTKLDAFPKPEGYEIAISADSGEGMEALKALIVEDAKALTANGLVLASRQRQLTALRSTQKLIEEACISEHLPLDLRAEMLRQAGNELGRITGRVDVEQLLDVIFSQFCIGK